MTVVVPPDYDNVVETDNLIRGDSTLEAMAKLRPVFDRKYGTITAGNSSPLTDGAAAVLLMSEDKAKALGIKPIGFIKSYAYAATDPFDQLLQGPVFALPVALERAKITLKDIGVIEMHEAFAAQVLSNIQWIGSKKIAKEKLGRSEPVGDIDPENDQPHRRLHRPRPSLRRDRRAHRDHRLQRAPAHRRAVRPGHRLRRGRHRRGDGAGAGVVVVAKSKGGKIESKLRDSR